MKNNSQSAIYYATTLKDGFLNFDPSNPTYSTEYKVNTNETHTVRIGFHLSCWEQVINSADGKLFIYIFDAETLESDGWSTIKNNPLKKYAFTPKQLNNMNWNISYP